MKQTAEQTLSSMRMQAAAELNIRSEIDELALEYGRVRTEDEEKNAAILRSLLCRQQDLLRRYHSVVLWLDRVYRALEVLPDNERHLLIAVYCDDRSPMEVMEELLIEKSTYYRLRKKALENFSKAFIGTVEPL